jgi:Tfp pilus assembly protein PilN
MSKINLLPRREPEKPKISLARFALIIILEIAIVGASALYAYRHFSLLQLEEDIDRIEAQIGAIRSDVDAVDRVQKRTAEIRKLIEEAEAIRDEGLASGRVMREVRDVIPRDIWLASLAINPNGGVKLSGDTFSMESVARLALAIEDSPIFGDVRVGSLNLAAQGDYEVYGFNIDCMLEARR